MPDAQKNEKINALVDAMVLLVQHKLEQEAYDAHEYAPSINAVRRENSLFKLIFTETNDFKVSIGYIYGNNERLNVNFSESVLRAIAESAIVLCNSQEYLQTNDLLLQNHVNPFLIELGSENKKLQDALFDSLMTDSNRTDLCWHLLTVSGFFLYFHEISHFIGGHLDYVVNKYKEKEFSELSYKESTIDIGKDIYKLFELSADTIAVDLMFIKFKNSLLNNGFEKTKLVGTKEYNWLRIMISAIVIIYCIIENEELKGKNKSNRHPDAYLRLSNLLFAIRNQIRDFDNGLHYINQYFKQIAEDIDSAYKILTGKDLNFIDFEEFFLNPNSPFDKILTDNQKYSLEDIWQKNITISEEYEYKFNKDIALEILRFKFFDSILRKEMSSYIERNMEKYTHDLRIRNRRTMH